MRCPKHEPEAEVVAIRGGVRYGTLVRCRRCSKALAMSPPQPSADAAEEWGRWFLAEHWRPRS